MLIVMMMGRWSDDSASVEDVCCIVVISSLVGVSVFSVIWS